MRGLRRMTVLMVLAGCGPEKTAKPIAAGPTPASRQAAPATASSAAGAAKFNEFSREIEKMGIDERADPGHLEQELKAILQIDAHFKPAVFDLAVLQQLRGDSDGAHKIFRGLTEDDANFAPAQENLAAVAVRDGHIEQATPVYEAIIAKNPKNLTSRLALARIDVQQKKYKEAIGLCRDVLQRQADATEAFRVLAESYDAIGDEPMAELIIGRGLRVAKDDVQLHFLAAKLLLDRNDLAGGVESLKQVIRNDPKRLDARAQLADIALQYRDFGNAATQYEAILKARPKDINVQLDLGVCYKGMGRYDQAEKMYKDVLNVDKDNLPALWNLGVLYHRHLNRYDDATAQFRHYKEVAAKDDERAVKVDGLLADINKLKSDQEAQRMREERERKKKEAVDAVCAAVAAKKPPETIAISEPERIEVAWQLMGNGQQLIQNGDLPNGEAQVLCAFAFVPDTPTAKKDVCAPMRVLWTQILYQLGRLEDANASIKEALKCDANNPDAQLITQQLKEIMEQQKSGAAAPAGAK